MGHFFIFPLTPVSCFVLSVEQSNRLQERFKGDREAAGYAQHQPRPFPLSHHRQERLSCTFEVLSQ
jgi:hypothetical protein